MASSESRYSGKVCQSQVSPSASAVPGMSSTPSSRLISQSWRSGAAGANPTPQLPMAMVVTPCSDDGAMIGSQVAWPSKCVWMSMKPGVTSAPSASSSRSAVESTVPTAVITPSVTSTSPGVPAAPVPSMIVPLRMMRSAMFQS